MQTSSGKLLSEVKEILLEFGLSEIESRMYLCCVELGARPASVLAKKADLKRGHGYNVLESLSEKGLVQNFLKRGVRHYVSSPPQVLLSMAEQKEQIMARLKDRLGILLPVIENIRHPLAAQPKVRFYHGIEGIKEVFEESIRVPGEPIYAVADAAFSLSDESRDLANFILKYIQRRIERNCWYYGICNKSLKTDRIMKSSKNAKRSVRMVENLPLPIELLIFRDRVAVVSLRGQFFGLIIEDQQIADTSKSIHETISRVLPPYASTSSAVSSR